MRFITVVLPALLITLAVRPGMAQAGFDEDALARYQRALASADIRETEDAGITRLVGDDEHGRFIGVQRIQLTDDGSVWVLRGSADDKLFRVGKARTWEREDGLAVARDLLVTADGELALTTNRSLVERDGKRWASSPKAPGVIRDALFDASGSLWAISGADLARFDGRRWQTFSVEDLGLSYSLPFEEVRTGRTRGGVSGIAATTDGSIWVGAHDRNLRPVGLARLVDDEWTEVWPFDVETRIGIADLAGGPDGSIWMRVVPDGDRGAQYLARWDGQEWSAWEMASMLDVVPSDRLDMTVLPDGRVWFRWVAGHGRTVLFDGETWTRIPAIGDSPDAWQTDRAPVAAPDGTLWVASDNGAYPQDVYIYDLDAVVPLAIEPAVAFDPR